LASEIGAAGGPASAAPYMIGDFFGGGARFFGASTLGGTQNVSVGEAGGARRFKIVEGNSPIPQDRLFFTFSHFVNPLVNVREQPVDLALVFATGRDYSIVGEDPFFQSGVPVTLMSVQNQATHLQPFLGAAWRPNDRLSFLFFTQWDFDARGNAVFMRDQGTLSQVGVFQEQSLWFIDFNVAYWLYRNPCARWITGVAPILEDQVTGPLGTVGLPPNFETPGPPGSEPHGRRDVLDLTAGLQFELGRCSSLTVAGVAPLKSGLNRDYDAEFVVQFNRRF
jgi:hypothetical protein